MKMKKLVYLLVLVISVLTATTSCTQEEQEFVPAPMISLLVKDYGQGAYLLDATESEAADEIKWNLPGVLNDTIWHSFGGSHAKSVVLPDLTIDYELTVTIRNPIGEVEKKHVIKATQVKGPNTYSQP